MARRSFRRPDTFWPGRGDILDDVENGISYEIRRANNDYDEVSEIKIRYALVLGRHPDFDEPIVLTFHDQDDPRWQEFLEEITALHLKKDDEYVDFSWDSSIPAWVTEG